MKEKIFQSQAFLKAKRFYLRHERRISTGALLFGFILDSLTLQRIDDLFENLVAIFYLFLAGLAIVLLNLYRKGSENNFLNTVGPFLPTFTQFAFGGLFSAFFIFYSRSGDFSSSWPFILILLFLLVGNEFFREYYKKQTFQISIYFLALYSYFIFFIPILFNRIGTLMFLLSGLVSMIVLRLFLYGLDKTAGLSRKGAVAWSVGSIFVLTNLFYFLNILPPIPLSLKDVGIYHFAEKTADGEYILYEEREGFFRSLIPGRTIHITKGSPLYAFTSVFAPSNIRSEIRHCWQYEKDGNWLPTSCISFQIEGGLDRGFRGFSTKTNLFPGKWRVNIETGRGQKIGHTEFKLEEVEKSPELEEKKL